ncbi:MAG: S1 RNA-binding domain-containing protein [Anaerolineae bacterium]
MANEESQAGVNGNAQPLTASDAIGAPSGERPAASKPLEPGTVYKGHVRNVVDFGAFIDIGVGRDGLVHISALKRAGIDKTLKVGDTIEVVIRRVDPADNRISLSLPDSAPEARVSKVPLQTLKVGSTVTGKVVRLADFGAFIDVGAQSDGLLHVSELPGGYVKNPSEVMKVGDEVLVRIQEVDTQKQRISLSMRQVQMAVDAQPQAAEETGEPLPTAFEVAFQKAKSPQRKHQLSTRR